MTRQPVQVWASSIHTDPLEEVHLRDLQRAKREWRGEQRIWLMPEAKQTVRWQSHVGKLPVAECVVPAEEFDWVEIYSIDEEGRVFPPLPLPAEWENRVPEGLYRFWLNVQPNLASAPDAITLQVPYIEGSSVLSRELELRLSPVVQIRLATSMRGTKSFKPLGLLRDWAFPLS